MRIPNLASYLKTKGFGQHQALLVYGNDEGAVQFHLDLLMGAFKKEGLTVDSAATLEDVDLGKEPGLFDDPNEQKVTVCHKITGRDFPALEKKLAAADSSHKLVLVGPGLGSKIKMVTFFQTAKHVGAIPSYDVSIPLLRSVIEAELVTRKLELSKEHIDVLVETYSGSPVSLMTDMEKLSH